MSNARGRRDGMPYNFPRPYRQPSWQDQPPNYFQNSGGWGESRSLWGMPQQSFGAWDNTPPNNMMPQRQPWPRQCFQGPSQQYEQFPPRYSPNQFSSQNGPPFSERTLAHLTQVPLDDSPNNGRNSREGHRVPGKSIHLSTSPNKNSRMSTTQDASSTSSKAGSCPQTARSVSTPKNVDRPNPLTQKPTTTQVFKTPNDDLRNMVKESLKTMNRGNASPAQTPTEEAANSPSRRSRESRVPSGDRSQVRRPSGDAPGRRPSVEFSGSPVSLPRTPTGTRRRAQSQSSTEGNNSSLLDDLGYIQKTGDPSASPSCSQNNDEEPVTISREQLNQYLRSMDNQQRRQLIEQPRDSISKSLLNHLVQKNQTNRARQLSSLRFRITSTDMELSSKSEASVMLSDQLLEEIKELLAQQDAEDAESRKPVDDEIEIIEPPPKTPPICIDLDCDDSPPRSEALKQHPQPDCQIKQQPSNDADPAEVTENVVEATSTEPELESISQDIESVVAKMYNSISTAVESVESGQISLSEVSNVHSTLVESETVTPSEAQPAGESQGMEVHLFSQAPVEAPVETTVEAPPVEETNAMSVDSNTEPTSTVQENDAVTKTANSSISIRHDLISLPPENCRSSTEATNETPVVSEPQLMIQSVTSLAQSEAPGKPAEEQGTVQVPQQEEESLHSRLMRLHFEEQIDLQRLLAIEQTIVELQSERRLLTGRLLSRKQEQFDLLRSSQQSNHDNRPVSSASNTSTNSASVVPSTSGERVSPKPVASPQAFDTSARLRDLAHQLEQNGVQVSLGSTLIVGKPVDSSSAKKRKRSKTQPTESEARKSSNHDESSSKSKKTSTSSNKRKGSASSSSVPPSPVASEPKKKKRKSTSSKTWDISTSPLKENTSKSKESSSTSTSKPAEPNVVDTSQKDDSSQKKVGESSQKEAANNPQPPVQQVLSKTAQDSDQSRSSPLPSSAVIAQSKAAPSSPLPSSAIVAQSKATPSSPLASSSKSAQSKPTPSSPSKQSKQKESSQQKGTSEQSHKERPVEKPAAKRTEPCDSTVSQSKEAKMPRCSEPTVNNEAAVSSAAPATPSTQNSLSTTPGLAGLLEPHGTCVRTMFVNGPGLFTASDDGTVHVYDHTTGILTMRVLGHQEPVTFLYAVSLKKTSLQLREISSTAQYLNNLNLITGSLDGFVRQFSLETGNVLHERNCHAPVTCAAANKKLSRLYIGTRRGDIFFYDPKTNGLAPSRIKAQSEIIAMKIMSFKAKKVVAVCAAEKNVVIYDCSNEERLMTLSTGFPNNSIHCLAASHYNVLYCCDANKRVFTFDLTSDKPLVRIDDLPSSAAGCHLYNSKFLFLACQDGAIRVVDISKNSRNSVTLTGTNPKTMSCMRFSDTKIICGTLAGEVFCRSIPRFAVATAVGTNGTSKK